jgi:pimeloyl-ACP methyl ester carboxylesterase
MLFKKILLCLTVVCGTLAATAAKATDTDYWVSSLTPTRKIQYQGLNVAVYESSGTRGPGILMIHGNTSSANAFAKVFESNFAKRNKVVLMDLPGYGASDNAAPSQYSIGFQTGAIVAVAQATGTAQGVLVGWSLGTLYAIQATTSLPALKGLFLFGDAVTSLDPTLPAPFLSPSQSYAGEVVNYGAVAALTPIQVVDYVNAFFGPNHGRVPRPMLNDGLRADPNTRQGVLNIILGVDPLVDPIPILANANFKLALVNGEEDAFVNNARFAAIEGLFPTLFRRHAILLPNVGHAPQIETPDRFISILQSFIQAL